MLHFLITNQAESLDTLTDFLKMHSERIPRSLLRGMRANTDIIKKSLNLGDSLQLAAGSFNKEVTVVEMTRRIGQDVGTS